MTEQRQGTITRLLREIEVGDEPIKATARDELFEAVHGELHAVAAALMRQEAANHTLQPSALVNEAALKLVGEDCLGKFQGRSHFYSAMANAMRRILVDHARKRKSQKRGGNRQDVALDEAVNVIEETRGVDLVELDEALERLKTLNERQSEVVVRRFFGGFEYQEIADQLDVSLSTVEKDWRIAKAWLQMKLGPND